MLQMRVAIRAGTITIIYPLVSAGITGSNNLVAVVEHHLLSFGGLVSFLFVHFHNNILPDMIFMFYYSGTSVPQKPFVCP